MKKYLLMVLVNLFFVLTNTKAQDRNNIGTEIVKDYLRKNTQVAKQVDVVASGNFAEYFSSPGFKNELQSGKWGSSVSMLINGIVEKIESNASEKDIDNFQKKLRSSALLDPTLLLAINALGAQIKEIIEKAQAAGQILEVEAANQILTVIEQARQAFRNELDRTLDRISIEANRALNSIKSVINDLEQGIYEHIRDLERRALEISHNLPLSKHFPQVNKWSPSYTYKTSQTYLKESKNWSNFLIVERRTIAQGVVVQSGVLNEDEYIHFEIDGDFYDLPSKNYNAALVINGHTYINKTKSSQDISFDIKKTDLEFNANSIKYNYAKVTIPYKKPVFLIFKRKEIAEFTLPIITLPQNVGALSIETTVKESTVITQDFRAGPYAQISDDDDIKCGGEHADLAIHCVPAEPGWRILPRTVSYQMIRSEGDWYSCGPDHSGQANACYSFSTIHHPLGTSGKIWFYLTYTAEKDALVEHNETTNIPINWEESKVFVLPNGANWKGTFKQFDGKTIEFTGPFENNYIKISQDTKNIIIKIKP